MICSLIQEPEQWSRAVKDSCQLIGVFAFAVEGAANRGESLGQGKDVARDKEIGVLSPDRMPVHSLRCDGNFRHKVGSAQGDTFGCGTAQSNPAYDSIFCGNLLLVEEVTELLSFGIGRDSGRQANAKTLRTSALDPFPRSRPRAAPTMEIVQLRRSAVQADLENNSITGQRSQAFHAPAGKQHSVGQHRGRCGHSATSQNVANVFEQKRLAPGDKDFLDAKPWRFTSDPLHPRAP